MICVCLRPDSPSRDVPCRACGQPRRAPPAAVHRPDRPASLGSHELSVTLATVLGGTLTGALAYGFLVGGQIPVSVGIGLYLSSMLLLFVGGELVQRGREAPGELPGGGRDHARLTEGPSDDAGRTEAPGDQALATGGAGREASSVLARRDERPAAGAVAFSASLAAAEDARAVCQVCGDPVLDEGLACAACGTPHHEDCWAYAGGCTTFGCAGAASAGKVQR